MSGRCRVDQSYRKFPLVPSFNACRCIQPLEWDLSVREPSFDSLEIVLVPVGDHDWIPIGSFDDVLQGIELPCMNLCYLADIVVDGTVCQLTEFPGEDTCICC